MTPPPSNSGDLRCPANVCVHVFCVFLFSSGKEEAASFWVGTGGWGREKLGVGFTSITDHTFGGRVRSFLFFLLSVVYFLFRIHFNGFRGGSSMFHAVRW